MEEIKVGEYIRTKEGYIEKIKDFKSHYTKGKRLGKSEEVVENYLSMGAKQCRLIESIDYSIPPCYPSDEELEKIKKHIVKHSPNILELIEVGDYVNGHLVIGKAENNLETLYICLDIHETIHKGEEIKTIVTKELFKNSEYEVK